jgi:hypothetical protein
VSVTGTLRHIAMHHPVSSAERESLADGGTADPGRRYWAFISYSQKDTAWAKKLHRFLETYRIPRALVGRTIYERKIPARLIPVFRDRDELAGDPNLGRKLQEALSASESLIVICSPHAAKSTWVNEEIRTYKSIGRADRIFPLLIEYDRSDSLDSPLAADLFPPALRFDETTDGVIAQEPLAADARSDKDGWVNACLKLIAGIIGVGFDDLRRRELLRQRRRRLFNIVAIAASIACLAAAYIGLADAEVPVPGGETVRRQLDHYEVSLFRPALHERQMDDLARSIRASLRQRLVTDVVSGVIEKEQPVSAWTIGEVVGAGFGDRQTPSSELRNILRLIDVLFATSDTGALDGRKLTDTVDDVGNPGRAEPLLWTIMALSAVLTRPEALQGEEHDKLIRDLRIAQTLARIFTPVPDGGWNTAARQVEPGSHFIYTTAMALHMLLEVRAAGLDWPGDGKNLDTMIADTANWLNGAYVADPELPGWRRSLSDDKPPDTGITLLAYAALGRACAEADTVVPVAISASALKSMADLRQRKYESADPDIRFDVRVADSAGLQKTQVTVTRMIWYGWATEGVASWLRCMRKHDQPPEVTLPLLRSLGHLLNEVGPDMVRDVLRPQRPLWINAETYYGLGNVP